MKKVTTVVLAVLVIFSIFATTKVFATEQILDAENHDQLVKIKENTAKTIEEYKEKYGSDTYGITAYVLNTVRIYSIPLCFLGIAVSAIYQYVIGIRKLDTQEKGLVMMVSFITIFVICQILPLACAIVVKFGRG